MQKREQRSRNGGTGRAFFQIQLKPREKCAFDKRYELIKFQPIFFFLSSVKKMHK